MSGTLHAGFAGGGESALYLLDLWLAGLLVCPLRGASSALWGAFSALRPKIPIPTRHRGCAHPAGAQAQARLMRRRRALHACDGYDLLLPLSNRKSRSAAGGLGRCALLFLLGIHGKRWVAARFFSPIVRRHKHPPAICRYVFFADWDCPPDINTSPALCRI